MDLYHVLNRGVDKRSIFTDGHDYLRFVHDLFEFNDQNNAIAVNYYAKSSDVGCPKLRRKRKLLVHIHTFCLMPNHYHLLLSPVVENGVSLFMKKLNGGYAKYFNERYERSGALFQGKYKSILIERDAHFLHIPYYIHFNPLDLTQENKEWRERKVKNCRKALTYLAKYRWSSHLDYLGIKNFPSVTQREFLLDFFKGEDGYEKSLPSVLRAFSAEMVGNNTLE